MYEELVEQHTVGTLSGNQKKEMAMKIYTGGGDKGTTSLFSGERVAKHHIRIETYGDVDELNSVVGALAACIPASEEMVHQHIQTIQSNLFVAGSWMATTPDSPAVKYLVGVSEEMPKELELWIDTLSEKLPVLKVFILPGGQQSACWAHLARTICRRCERRLSAFIESATENTPEELSHILVYLNRLSDYFFVLARYLNALAGTTDIAWKNK